MKDQITGAGVRKLIVIIYIILFAFFYMFYKLQMLSQKQFLVFFILAVPVLGIILAAIVAISKKSSGVAGGYTDTRSKSRIVFDGVVFILWVGGIVSMGFFILPKAIKEDDKYGIAVGIIALMLGLGLTWAVVSMLRMSKRNTS